MDPENPFFIFFIVWVVPIAVCYTVDAIFKRIPKRRTQTVGRRK